MSACAASAEATRGLSPRAETRHWVCRGPARRLVPDPSPRNDLADADRSKRRPGLESSDLPRRRQVAAGAEPHRPQLRLVRVLHIARIAARHPVAGANAALPAIRNQCSSARGATARATGPSGRCRPTARTTLHDLSLAFRPRCLRRRLCQLNSVESPSHVSPKPACFTGRRQPAFQRIGIRTRLRRPAHVRQHADHRRSQCSRRSFATNLLLPAATERGRPGIKSLRNGI